MLDNEETHPSWAVARFNRISSSPPGLPLFDSSIRHPHAVILTIETAVRSRSLQRDWIRADRHIIEVAMSSAQFGGLVSSFGDGTGVPVTIQSRDGGHVPEPPFDSRLAETANEVRDATRRGTADIQDAFERVDRALNPSEGKPRIREIRDAVDTLRHQIRNLPSNMRFAANSMTEHTETVVAKAKADIEAMVDDRARALGVDRDQLGLGTVDLPASIETSER